MSLVITTKILSDAVIIDLSDKSCFLESALQKRVKELLEAGYRDFVVNLTDLPYLDSFALGELISIWTSINGRGGRMVLVKPTPDVREVLEMTKVDRVFPIVQSEERAIRRLQK